VTEHRAWSPEILTIPTVKGKGTISSFMNRLLWSYAKTPTHMTIAIPSLIEHMDLAAILGLS